MIGPSVKNHGVQIFAIYVSGKSETNENKCALDCIFHPSLNRLFPVKDDLNIFGDKCADF